MQFTFQKIVPTPAKRQIQKKKKDRREEIKKMSSTQKSPLNLLAIVSQCFWRRISSSEVVFGLTYHLEM